MASDFDIERMPRDLIVPRQLHTWSAHYSIAKNCWIATISRPHSGTSNASSNRMRYQQFSLPTERDARKFCQAFAPPKLSTATECRLCRTTRSQATIRLMCHCRNCGVTLCDRCSCRWERKMLPRTYFSSSSESSFSISETIRVCKSCDWLSNAFCLALLQGRYQDAIQIHATGNVNLRTRFAAIHCEAMFPIHCAVMGGSLDLVKWLIEAHNCPWAAPLDPTNTQKLMSVQTSACRTLLDLTMTGRPKLAILAYLVRKGLSVEDVKDKTLIPKTLELLLMSDAAAPAVAPKPLMTLEVQEVDVVEPCLSSCDSLASLEDPCKLCFERSMSDCVLQPCGHQVCCADCGSMLHLCPVCKQECSVMRIFRQ